jgi:hypothetical protein
VLRNKEQQKKSDKEIGKNQEQAKIRQSSRAWKEALVPIGPPSCAPIIDWCRWRLTYALRVGCVPAAGEVFGLKWEAAKLDTGLGVVRVAMPGQSGLLSYYSIVRAGARNEVEVSPPQIQIDVQ